MFDGKRLVFFVDGRLTGRNVQKRSGDKTRGLQVDEEISGTPKHYANVGFFIGSTDPAAGPQVFFHGIIDEVRISNIARYTEDFTPQRRFEPDEHTMALYHFDEGSGDVLKDSSGNGHDGKIVGAKWVKVDEELGVCGRAFGCRPDESGGVGGAGADVGSTE